MTTNRHLVAVHLRAAAALAESTAVLLEAGKLWEGELSQKLRQIRSEVMAAESESEDRGR